MLFFLAVAELVAVLPVVGTNETQTQKTKPLLFMLISVNPRHVTSKDGDRARKASIL